MATKQRADDAPTTVGTPVVGSGCDAVLDTLRAFRQEEIHREQAKVLLAVEWVRLNPSTKGQYRHEPLYSVSLNMNETMWDELSLRGCPHVDDLSVPAFAEAAGLTELQATRLIREAILLVYLLPKVWERTSQGQIEVWRARKLAEDCWELSPEAIAYIDHQMSQSTARHTEGGRSAIITEAKLRFMPEEVEAEEELDNEARQVRIDWSERRLSGLAAFWAVMEIPDALALEAALKAGAKDLKARGAKEPLGVRRAWALGDLARAFAQPDQNGFLPGCACEQHASPTRPHCQGSTSSTFSVYMHLTPSSLIPQEDRRDAGAGFAPIRVEGEGIPSGMLLTPQRVRGWFTRPSTAPGPKITFRPVLDLEDHQHVDAYEVPDRIKEQVSLRDGGCVFPWCHRKARRSDCDHTLAWKPDGEGGPTCSCNLAPLCRRHHRAKTHADNHKGSRYTWWRYEQVGDGKYLWRGPGGSVLLRTNSGVFDVSADEVSGGPRVPGHRRRAITLAGVMAGQTLERIREYLPRPGEHDERFPDVEKEPDVDPCDEPDIWEGQEGVVPPF